MSTPDGQSRHKDHDGGTEHEEHRDEHLACGRSLDALLDQVAEQRSPDLDAHQAQCVHCQAALGEYDRLWSPLRDLAAEKVTAPVGKIDDALARIRGAIEEPDYATLRSADGLTRVAARVVVAAAWHSAQDVPGVRVALSKNITGAAAGEGADSEVSVGVAGASTAIEITLAADYGQELHKLGDRVRQAVATRVRHLTDLEPVQITVIIDDILP